MYKEELDSLHAGIWLDDDYNPHYGVTRKDEKMIELADKAGIELHLFKYSNIELLEIMNNIPLGTNGMYEKSIDYGYNAVEVCVDERYYQIASKTLLVDPYFSEVYDAIRLVPVDISDAVYKEFTGIK